jgi:hypothetical protein
VGFCYRSFHFLPAVKFLGELTNEITLLLVGKGGKGFLPLNAKIRQKFLFNVIITREYAYTQTIPDPGFLMR